MANNVFFSLLKTLHLPVGQLHIDCPLSLPREISQSRNRRGTPLITPKPALYRPRPFAISIPAVVVRSHTLAEIAGQYGKVGQALVAFVKQPVLHFKHQLRSGMDCVLQHNIEKVPVLKCIPLWHCFV